jgi:hypothetical protein
VARGPDVRSEGIPNGLEGVDMKMSHWPRFEISTWIIPVWDWGNVMHFSFCILYCCCSGACDMRRMQSSYHALGKYTDNLLLEHHVIHGNRDYSVHFYP